MAHVKPRGKKIRLGKEIKANKLAPIWAAIKAFGLKRGILLRRRMNRHVRRHWRRVKLKK